MQQQMQMPQISLQKFGYAVWIYPILGYWSMSEDEKKRSIVYWRVINCALVVYKMEVLKHVTSWGIETYGSSNL